MNLLERAETDWLASIPVFYNEKNCKISNQILDVIDFNKFEFDSEGLCNYLRFGYSILGQTMIKNVKFLHPNSVIEKRENKLQIFTKTDPAEALLNSKVEKKEE